MPKIIAELLLLMRSLLSVSRIFREVSLINDKLRIIGYVCSWLAFRRDALLRAGTWQLHEITSVFDRIKTVQFFFPYVCHWFFCIGLF